MNQTLDEEGTLRKYLLHELEEAEQDRLEERFLTDKEFGRRLEIAQADLIDDYVAGVMSEGESERFRTHYLTTPARLQKLKFAMALDRYVTEATDATEAVTGEASATKAAAAVTAEPGLFEKVLAFFRARPLKAAFSVFGAVLVLGVAVLILFGLSDFRAWRGYNLRQELTRVNHMPEADSVPLSKLSQGSASTPVLSLTTDLARGDAEPQTVEVTSGVKLIRLLLEVAPGPYDHFRAVLQTATGDELAAVENLKARSEDDAQFVVVNVPPGFFDRGDFRVRLFGIDRGGRAVDLGPYQFRVTTR
jgi:hypothetical protein